MQSLEQNLLPTDSEKKDLKVFGVGDAGVRWLMELGAKEFSAASLVAVNTDVVSLNASVVPEKIHVENQLLRGLGSGGDAERSRALAEEQFIALKTACAGAKVVFVLAGLGGGAGSGIAPVLARAAHETGALVLAFVTMPFNSEGSLRRQQAQQSLELLKASADGVVVLASDKIFGLINPNTSVLEVLSSADRFLFEGFRGVWQLLTRRGMFPLRFDDLCALLRDRHVENCFACVEAAGAARAREIVEKFLAHPLLDQGRALAESDAVLINFTAGSDLSMAEINRVMDEVNRHCGRAKTLVGAAVDAAMGNRLCVTLVVAQPDGSPKPVETSQATQPLRGTLPNSSVNAPVVPVFNRLSLRRGSKPVQGQLPLSVVNKGRFDKSEPTLHDGEDLDVPTFLRRGVVLN